jgi:hypothetical protein
MAISNDNGGGVENASLQESVERHVRDTSNFIGHSTHNNCNRLFSSAIVLAIEPGYTSFCNKFSHLVTELTLV